jgi:diguanylate cyclase (GGDEF)-like protein
MPTDPRTLRPAMPALIESVARMTGSRDRGALEASVLSVAADVLRPATAALYRLVDAAGAPRVHRAIVVDSAGRAEPAVQPACADDLPALDGRSEAAACLAAGKPEVVVLGGGGYRCLLPVSAGRAPAGWIEVDCGLAPSPEQVRILAGLVRVYGNHLAILEYSEHDSLTGLMNRKTFDESFLKTLAACQRDETGVMAPDDTRARQGPSSPHWLAVGDVDHFKRINDRFGHLYGDEVLVLLARLMRSSFRISDRLYRFGGEEFAILLDRTAPAHAADVFERFRAATQAFRFPQVGEVTVSVGFTRALPGDSPSAAFDRADAALYYAKEHGRNRICSHEALVESGALAPSRAEGGEVELF